MSTAAPIKPSHRRASGRTVAIREADSLASLLVDVRACRTCESALPLGPRPVVQASAKSRVLIIGQAPSRTVHETGIPWNDLSGERLRDWLGVNRDEFYDPEKFAIVPMGFCFPGTGPNGDLPPRRECAEQWHDRMIRELRAIELTLLIGQYAQRYVLGTGSSSSVTGTVAAYADYAPHRIPLPHPSPRNRKWLLDNAWFEHDVIPLLKKRVSEALAVRNGVTT